MSKQIFINVGCGDNLTDGFVNLDGSPSLVLARWPRVARLLRSMGVLTAKNEKYIQFLRDHDVQHVNAGKCLPFSEGTVDLVYSCHMFEHLRPQQTETFLKECHRVLKPNGVLRLVVPDLRKLVEVYLDTGDADRLVHELHLSGFWGAFESIKQRLALLVTGAPSAHKWMYDGPSLVRCLERVGFHEAQVMKPGKTLAEHHGALDLRERLGDSVYVEAKR